MVGSRIFIPHQLDWELSDQYATRAQQKIIVSTHAESADELIGSRHLGSSMKPVRRPQAL
jgi:hypothetical protein